MKWKWVLFGGPSQPSRRLKCVLVGTSIGAALLLAHGVILYLNHSFVLRYTADLAGAFLMLGGAIGYIVADRIERREKHLSGLSAAGFCPNCGYNLTGNVSGVCPECGMVIRKGE